MLTKPKSNGAYSHAKDILLDHSTPVFTACIIAQSGLAEKFLLQVLSPLSGLDPIPLKEFIKAPRNPRSTVFIFDASSLVLPLAECVRRLLGPFAGAKYLVIDRARTAPDVVKLLLLGVHGYLDDGQVIDDLPEAVQTVLGGNLWVAEAVLQQYVIFTAASNRENGSRAHTPTQREVQILELVQQRYSNKEIAQMFNIQESTIKFHLNNLFGKLGVMNRRGLLNRNAFLDVWERLLKYRVPVIPVPSAESIASGAQVNQAASAR
jgi:DNA-binding NarL/FixJ family response regulator